MVEREVKIRPLEWDTHPDYPHELELYSREYDDGLYFIRTAKEDEEYKDGAIALVIAGVPSSWHGSEDEAKAAAQADYEARIRSALLPTTRDTEAEGPFYCIEHSNGWSIQDKPHGGGTCIARDYGEGNLKMGRRIAAALNREHRNDTPTPTTRDSLLDEMAKALEEAVNEGRLPPGRTRSKYITIKARTFSRFEALLTRYKNEVGHG